MSGKKNIYWIFGIFCAVQVFLLISSSNGSAPGYITLSIQAKPPTVNINKSNEPLIMHCAVGFQGASVLPYTVHMDASSDVGEVYLTQYQFVFHYPETVPFDAIIFIDPETENDTEGQISLTPYYEEGGVRYSLGTVSQIITILNYDPDYIEENESKGFAGSEYSNDPIFLFAFPSLFIFLAVLIVIIRPRLKKKRIIP